MVFLFHQNLVANHIKFLNIQEGLSFFTRIWLQTLSKFRITRWSFFYTRIWLQTLPKFKTYRRVILFQKNLVADRTEFQDIQQGLSFSPEFGCRSYQISGHTVGSFFFTRIWGRSHQISGHTIGSFFFNRIWLQTLSKFRTYKIHAFCFFLFFLSCIGYASTSVQPCRGWALKGYTHIPQYPEDIQQTNLRHKDISFYYYYITCY